MQFVYPYFLFAISAISIPIIVHLFNFRRYKKIYFTNVRFLKEVKDETTHRSRLKHLLVLFSRILAIIFLVFAFAQPYIPKNEAKFSKGTKVISIFIDNSFSMNAVTEDHSLFDKAKLKAKEIVSAYKSDDRFQLLTNDFEGKHQRPVSKEEFLTFVDEVIISPSVKNISEIISRQKELSSAENSTNKIIFLISDFQKNILDFDKTEKDTYALIHFIPLKSAAQNNVFIESCWFESPVQMLKESNRLIVRLKNIGTEEKENSRLTLKINSQIKAITDFSISKNSVITDTINFNITQAGWHRAELSITDYPITFDDNYFFTFNVAQIISVLIINEDKESQHLNAVFNFSDSLTEGKGVFLLHNSFINQLDYSTIKQNQFVVLNGVKNLSSGLAFELKQFVEQGGSVLIFPNLQMDLNSYNAFLQAIKVNEFAGIENKEKEVTRINTEEIIFRDVFENIPQNMSLPKAKSSLLFAKKYFTTEESLLKFKDGNSFVSKYSVGKGKLYMCASPLDLNYSDLPVHSLFVPMLYKMAIGSTTNAAMSYNLANDKILDIGSKIVNGKNVFKISGNGNEFCPEQKISGENILINLHDQIKTAGIYTLKFPDNSDSLLLAFNYDRRESDMTFPDEDELKEKCKQKNIILIEKVNTNLTSLIQELNEGIILWKLCIIFALIFLGIEILLLRFWK